jgi:hypothetical protein
MTTGENKFSEEAAIGSLRAQSGAFEAPPTGEGQSSQGSGSEFEPPPFESGEGRGGVESSDASQQVLDVKGQIEQRLAEAANASAMSLASARSIDSPGVVGVGLSSGLPGLTTLVVYVESEANEEQVRREIVDTLGVQAASSDDLPVDVVVTGPIEPLTSNRSRFRPAPAGASVGHFSITAGTIGGWSRGRGNRSSRLLMVSNNHVLAASNTGKFGDAILQPGPTDGGKNPADRIAILERFVTITFGGAANYVDCATAWCWPDLVRRDHVYHTGATSQFFKVGTAILEPSVNMIVGKTGRTTNLKQGRVQATGVSINVNYGTAGVAHFRDQFAVRSVTADPFSAGGDSGSFVWQWATGVSPVGLLFAGGGGTTFCNRMSRVVTALDVTLI